MKQRFYSIESFGCQMNLSDSERIAAQLESLGYVPGEKIEQSDIIVVNTCCVRESAENRIFGRIGALKNLKNKNPNLLVVVAGCLAQKDQQAIFRRASHVDLVLGTQNIDRLAQILQEDHKHKRVVESGEYAEDGLGDGMNLRPHAGASAWIPVMFGCDNYCSYCIVPYVRGRERSRPAGSILQEVQAFAKNGGSEITLLGQNVNSYGKNLADGWNFPRLLREVDLVEGIRRIRFMTSHPKDFGEELIEAMAGGRNLCEHLHLPVQSGSDEVLQRMNRVYSTAAYRRHVEKLRALIPGLSLTTGIIVGFPGETEAMFAETLDFIAEMKYDSAFTFLYSKRSGTPAAAMDMQVPPEIKKERLQRLMSLQNEISLQANQQWVGQTLEILVDGPSKTDPSTFTGRTRQNRIVLWQATPEDKPGLYRKLRITAAQTFLLKGTANLDKEGDEP